MTGGILNPSEEVVMEYVDYNEVGTGCQVTEIRAKRESKKESRVVPPKDPIHNSSSLKSKKMAGGGFERCPFIEKCNIFKEFKKLESSVHGLCTFNTLIPLLTKPFKLLQ